MKTHSGLAISVALGLAVAGLGLAASCSSTPPAQRQEDGAPAKRFRHNELTYLVSQKGDENAYRELKEYHAKDRAHGHLLFYAMRMAHQFGHDPAYFDVFQHLTEDFETKTLPIELLDEATANLAVAHLVEAAARGDQRAKEWLQHSPIDYDESSNRTRLAELLAGGR